MNWRQGNTQAQAARIANVAVHRHLFEWIMTLAMMGSSITVMLWPSSVHRGSLNTLFDFGLSPDGISFLFFVFGIVRMLGLMGMGRWPFCPDRLRAIGASLAALLWSQMTLGVWQASLEHGIIMPAVAIMFCLVVGEIIAVYRAAQDVRPRAHN